MKNNRKLMAATAILATVALAAPAFAWTDGWSGTRMNRGAGAMTDTQPLTTEQQKKVDETQSKYQSQLPELQQKLNAKQDELIAARSDDATTVGQLNQIESELYNLERDYWTKLDQANQEVRRAAGGGYDSRFTCDYRGCDHDRHGMMRDSYRMSDRSMSDGNDGSCCR